MATLTYTNSQAYNAPAAKAPVAKLPVTKPARSGFFARLTAAMMESRERQARREINRMLSIMGEPKATRDAMKTGNLPF